MNRNDKEFIIQKIRTQYTEKRHSELDTLKALDKKVKRPANIFAYVFGTLGALIMGCGMSLVMTDVGSVIGISDALVPGIAVGIIGLIFAVFNYPMYKAILSSRKKKYADDIIALSDKMING